MKSFVGVVVALALASAPIDAVADQAASTLRTDAPPSTSLPPQSQTESLPQVAIGAPVAPPVYASRVPYERRSRIGLQVAGSIVFGVFYGFALVFAVSAGVGTAALPADGFLAIPVAGPFIVACDLNLSNGDRTWILVDGVFQLVGAAGLAAGTIFRRQVPLMEMGRVRAPSWGMVPSAPGAPIGASFAATF